MHSLQLGRFDETDVIIDVQTFINRLSGIIMA